VNRLLQIARMALLLTAAGLCASGGWFLWNLSQLSSSLRTDVVKIGAVADQASATLQTINRPCGAGHACGTLADIGKTLNTARLTLGQIEIAANHEDMRIGVLDAQEAQIASDTHAALAKVSTDLDSVKSTVDGLQPSEQALTAELGEAEKATAAVTALASDPNLREMAANLNAASENANMTLAHASATTADVQQAVHAYLHPSWAAKIWHGITNTGVEVAKFLW
jgi:hypothetical protein